MTYEELLISIDLNGYENVLPTVGKTYFNRKYWFVICDDGDCHLFDRYGKEDDILKIKEIYEDMIPKDVKKIIIPNSVTNIRDWTFFNCRRLASITIPNSMMSIGNYVFYNCSSLTSVTILNNVMSIGNYAFSECSSLMNVTIGNGVTRIEQWVFHGCRKLTSITIDKPIEQVKSMKNYPFGIEDESIIKCN